MDNQPIQQEPTTLAPIQDLRRRYQVRRILDMEHVERLCEVLDRCPPILLSSDGFIVDGEHRVAAARRLGRSELPAVVLPEDDEGSDMIRCIEANVAHGLPLTREERRDAVAAVLTAQPELSDREIARICGVARSVVATRRSASCSGGSDSHLNGRIGGDGKRYGGAPARWRQHLEALLRVDPTISVRTLADRVGVSVGAVHAERKAILSQIATERFLRRAWRRLIARWHLRRLNAGSASTTRPERES